MSYETILYDTDGAVATITLNRPERLNTIVPPMPDELEHAVIQASRDPAVRVIVVRGAGRAFCAGFDFSDDVGAYKDALSTEGRWVPDAQAAVTRFLDALKGNDFTAMYSTLASGTQAIVPQDAFIAKYNETLNTMGAASLDYQVMSQLLSPTAAQVGFKIIYHTSLVGDLERDMVALLELEQGQWKMHWDDSLILPELAGGNVLKMDYRIPGRGDIYDRDGDPIVVQTDAYALGIKPGDLAPNNSGALVGALARFLADRHPRPAARAVRLLLQHRNGADEHQPLPVATPRARGQQRRTGRGEAA